VSPAIHASWPPNSGSTTRERCAVRNLAREQTDDYAARSQRPVAEVEKWLSPYLGYEA
jgi:hypothetical protein